MSSWTDYEWELIVDGPRIPPEQMALDEVILREVAAGTRKPALRFWEWQGNAVIIGRFQSVRNEVDPEGARRHDITVVRRITGGGAMFVEPKNAITYSIYAPEELVAGLSFVDSYQFMDTWVVESLRMLGVDAFYVPINDISSTGGKIGGAAQTRRNGAVLHHVTMSYDMDVAKMLEVLRIGKEKLSDKGTKSAAKRVSPLLAQTQLPRDAIIDRMIGTFRDRYGLTESRLSDDEEAAVRELAEQKFASDDWTYVLP